MTRESGGRMPTPTLTDRVAPPSASRPAEGLPHQALHRGAPCRLLGRLAYEGRRKRRRRVAAVKSEYAGTDAFIAYCRPAASSSSSFPGTKMFSWCLLLLVPCLGALFALLLSCSTF